MDDSTFWSLPIRGAWIEIPCPRGGGWRHAVAPHPGSVDCNAHTVILLTVEAASLPIRGAWIEIFHLIGTTLPILSLPIRGAWIEIGSSTTGTKERDSRSPFGERGLKSVRQGSDRQRGLVAPHPGSVD